MRGLGLCLYYKELHKHTILLIVVLIATGRNIGHP